MAHVPTIRKSFNDKMTVVEVGSLTLVYSYETVVAFTELGASQWYVSENVWGPTTGKHIGSIDGNTPENKRKRLSRDDFTACLQEVVDSIGL